MILMIAVTGGDKEKIIYVLIIVNNFIVKGHYTLFLYSDIAVFLSFWVFGMGEAS